jgi:hypothetical protein
LRSYEHVDEVRDRASLDDARTVLFHQDELIGIGSPVGAYGHCLGPTNKLCAALAKPTPAPPHLVTDATSGCSIPTFHWVNDNPVARPLAIDTYRNGLRQRGVRS